MQTNSGTKKFTIKDIPLKKWTQFTLVLQTMELDAYVDGKLKDTFVLGGLPKINHGDLYLNEWGGYSGSFSSIQYYPTALMPSTIIKKYKEGPTQMNAMQKIIKKVKQAAKAVGLAGSADKEPGRTASQCTNSNKQRSSLTQSIKNETESAFSNVGNSIKNVGSSIVNKLSEGIGF